MLNESQSCDVTLVGFGACPVGNLIKLYILNNNVCQEYKLVCAYTSACSGRKEFCFHY